MSGMPKKWRTLLDKRLVEMELQEEEETSESSLTLVTPLEACHSCLHLISDKDA